MPNYTDEELKSMASTGYLDITRNLAEDALEARVRIAELEAALKPIATLCEQKKAQEAWMGWKTENDETAAIAEYERGKAHRLYWGDLRHAAAVLKGENADA